jgi:hypothetical protein
MAAGVLAWSAMLKKKCFSERPIVRHMIIFAVNLI